MRISAWSLLATFLLLHSCVIQMDEVLEPSPSSSKAVDRNKSQSPDGHAGSANSGSGPQSRQTGEAATEGAAYLGVQLSFHLFDMQDTNGDFDDIDNSVAITADYISPITEELGFGIVGGLSRQTIGYQSFAPVDVETYRLFAGPALRWSPSSDGPIRPFVGMSMGLETAHVSVEQDDFFFSSEDTDTAIGMFFRPTAGLRFGMGGSSAFDLAVTMHFSEPFDTTAFAEEEEAMLTLGFATKL
jgi:hypothetical protein